MKKLTAMLCLLALVCGLAACAKKDTKMDTKKTENTTLSVKTTLYAGRYFMGETFEAVEFKLTGELPGKNRETGEFSGRIEVKESNRVKHSYEDLQYCWVGDMLLLYCGNPTSQKSQGMLCWIDPENPADAVLVDRGWRERNATLEVLALVSEDLTISEARSVGTIINQNPNVHKAVFVSRENAWEDFTTDHGNDPAFGGVDATVLRHRYVITVERTENIEITLSQIAEIPGIAKVSASLWAPESLYVLSPEQNVEKMQSLLEKLPKLPE